MGTEPGPGRLLRVPEEVAAALESRLHRSGFSSLEEFVVFVLSRLAESPAEEPFSAEEEARLKERLRSLGYID
ncbi:MAG: CopG family transcriptional regulator [Thermoplasmata archaeon]|nr:CopG family transcriptional regulator [Thermoplasmata archaeon]MCI4342130.1 CopG family transcriptional regulator [Thermoplasmata archaeon]